MSIEMETMSGYPWIRVKWNILSSDGSMVARIFPWDESGCRKEDSANANVISASPELYCELKYAFECISEGVLPGEEWKERTENVIRKAEGIYKK